MQQDEVVWGVIGHGQCSFRVRTSRAQGAQAFCREEHNVTGLCNRSSCPLANSRYATVQERDGRLYLLKKTAERAHTPARMWERRRLPKSYAAALAELDSQLEHWPKFLVHKAKQRLTKITQYLIRLRRLASQARPKLVTEPVKARQKEARREEKARAAAKLDRAVEAELLSRLQQGTYGDIYNFPRLHYERYAHEEEDLEDLAGPAPEPETSAFKKALGKRRSSAAAEGGRGSSGGPARRTRSRTRANLEVEYEEEREPSMAVT
eukprot:jgi/Chlat1/6645/Chrsp49S00476